MKENFRTLDIIGYDNEKIRNTFVKQEEQSEKLAIIFPGIGYTCHMPLLYYTAEILLQKGFDVLLIEYNYNNGDFGLLSEEKKLQWLNFDADAAYNSIMNNSYYKRVVLVGKSLGSFALARLNEQHGIRNSIWLTPSLQRDHLYKVMRKHARDGLFVIGTEDPAYQKEKVDELKKSGGSLLVVPDANHSMEIEDNTYKSIDSLVKVLKAVDKFI